jgi:hypothetical protein
MAFAQTISGYSGYGLQGLQAFPQAYGQTFGAAPFGYGAAPVVAAAPVAYGAAPVAYGAAPVAYGAAPLVGYGAPAGRLGKKENKFLNKEYAERVQAEHALAYGNYAGATFHDARADRWGVKADKSHFRGYNKGSNGSPYAFHPLAPSAGIAAVQPGAYGTQFAQQPIGAPMYANAVQLGLAGAPVTSFPGTAFGGYPGSAFGGSTYF